MRELAQRKSKWFLLFCAQNIFSRSFFLISFRCVDVCVCMSVVAGGNRGGALYPSMELLPVIMIMIIA